MISTLLTWVNSSSYKLDEDPQVSESWCLPNHLAILLILSLQLLLPIESYKVTWKLQCKSRKPMSDVWMLWPDGWSLAIVSNIVGNTQVRKKGSCSRHHRAGLPGVWGIGGADWGTAEHYVSPKGRNLEYCSGPSEDDGQIKNGFLEVQ